MSVRSIIGGDLTLGNLNVTTINDLPYSGGGGGGTVINGSGTVGSFTLTITTVAAFVDTITLPIGVWSVQMASYNVLSANGYFNYVNAVLFSLDGVGNPYFYSSQSLFVQATTSANGWVYEFINNVVISVTTPTTFTYSIQANIAGTATYNVQFPSLGNGTTPLNHFLVATKLA
jgi:hypothetical protein